MLNAAIRGALLGLCLVSYLVGLVALVGGRTTGFLIVAAAIFFFLAAERMRGAP